MKWYRELGPVGQGLVGGVALGVVVLILIPPLGWVFMKWFALWA